MSIALTKRLILALDTPDVDSAIDLARRTRSVVGTFKVGLELYTAAGPAIVKELRRDEADVFLDLKLHDIPNTVAGAVRAAQRHEVTFLTVHASGGPSMLKAAQAALAGQTMVPGAESTKLLAVTALTSLSSDELGAIGLQGTSDDVVARLAKLARDAGLFGVVCSPREAALVKKAAPSLSIVCPGIRGANDKGGDDQARTASAFDAVKAGADYVVVGRPIRSAPDPAEAAARIVEEIEQGLHARP